MNRNERIFSVVDEMNISNVDLARKLNTSAQQVTNWRSGRVIPDKYVLLFIEEFVNIDARWVLTGINSTSEKEKLLEEIIKTKNVSLTDKERTIKIQEKYIALLEPK